MDYLEKYKYLYETHLHTSEASRCASNNGKEMARAHKEAGYTGIFVTNHNWGGNTAIDRNLSWDKWVDEFSRAYYETLNEAEKIGLQVFYGWESGYNGTEFLIYGLDDKWLKDNPEIFTATVEEQYKLVHEGGGIVIHAHPYREEWYIPEIRLFPEYVDGVEVINATHSSHKSQHHNVIEFNDRAREYAAKYKLPATAGSDVHSIDCLNGGMLFKDKIKDSADFIRRILKREDYLLTDGDRLYNNKGELIQNK